MAQSNSDPLHGAEQSHITAALAHGHIAVPEYLEVIRPAGRGSFCDIWKVRDRENGWCYALKQIRPEWVDDPGARGLLAKEAEAGQAVPGRHVVRVIRTDHESSPPFNLLEWVEGETLERRPAEQEWLPAGIAIWIARQCALGLQELADFGYGHGDVKPHNIVLDDAGGVKLIDLGFAFSVDQSPLAAKSGFMTGTPQYMAPESLSREIMNPLTRDMYSLGVVLYRLISGRLPFTAASTDQVLRLHCSSRPPRLEPRSAGVPEELLDLVGRLLAKQPIRRPQSYASLIRELTALELATLSTRFAA